MEGVAAIARIGVFGLGYVGAVSMTVLADGGHELVGVDLNPTKVELINTGMSPLLLESILPSNRRQIDRAFELVAAMGRKRVGVLGLSFKAGTDDLRESPMVELIEQLVEKGYDVRVYDRNVSLANLRGAIFAYIEREIPHIASLMVESIDEVLASSEVIVIGNDAPEFARVLEDATPERHTFRPGAHRGARDRRCHPHGNLLVGRRGR